jgi:hypothetical protein
MVDGPTWKLFVASDEDEAAIEAARDDAGVVDWDSPHLVALKQRIKKLHLLVGKKRCCYCRKLFNDEFMMVVDIEHVIPKKKHGWCIFSPVNLTLACKRCNMMIKKDRTDFLVDESEEFLKQNIEESTTYSFIHPNLDKYTEHLRYVMSSVDDVTFVHYLDDSASPKGKRTFEFFRLKDAEVDELDLVQGMPAGVSERAVKIRALFGL